MALLPGAVVIAAILLRLPGLGDGLSHDEAYTWHAFASHSISVITGHYPVPNNHILHSLLVSLSAGMFGDSELALRLPALLAGILGVAATWWFALVACRLLPQTPGSRWIPLLAAAMMALNASHIGWSQVARGYSMLVLFSALSGGTSLAAQLQRRRAMWPAYSVCLFLALYTQPSAALLALGLASWSIWHAVRCGDRQLLTSVLAAHGAVLAACVLAYGRIVAAVVEAGRMWGIDLHAGSFAAAGGLLLDVATQPHVLALAAAAFGALQLRRQPLFGLFGCLAAAAVVVPVIYGTAPQARGYLYLLPWIFTLGAFGVASVSAPANRRLAALAVLLPVGLLSTSAALTHDSDAGWRDIAAQVNERSPRGEILVAPFRLDVEVYHYARPAIQQGIVTALMDGRASALLWATQSPRYDLGYYEMSTMDGGSTTLRMPTHAFERVYASGDRAVFKLRSSGQSVMPESWQWNAHPEEVANISFGAAGPAVGERPGLAVRNDGGRPFRVYSDTRFQPPGAGICVVMSARTDPQSRVSLYQVAADLGEGDIEQVNELQMLTTAARPVQGVGRDQRLWQMEAYLLPVEAEREYGVYLRGSSAQRQDFCDIRVLFFPNP